MRGRLSILAERRRGARSALEAGRHRLARCLCGAAALLLVLTARAEAQRPGTTLPQSFQYCAAVYDPTLPWAGRDYQVFLTAVHRKRSQIEPGTWWTQSSAAYPKTRATSDWFPAAFRAIPHQGDEEFVRSYEDAGLPGLYPLLAEEYGLQVPSNVYHWTRYEFLCNVYPDRAWAAAARDSAVDGLRAAGIDFRPTRWVEDGAADEEPVPPAQASAPAEARPAPRAALTVVAEDPAAVRARREEEARSREEGVRAAQALKRQRAMQRAVQEQIARRNIELKKRVAERQAEIARRRAACRAGDRSACRVDLERAGATPQ